MDKNTLSHTTWECKYHIVFAPKLLFAYVGIICQIDKFHLRESLT